jgi:hypothetical protein
MRFKKPVRYVGASLGIILGKSECKAHNIELGDYLDMTDVIVIKSIKNKHKRKNKNDNNM